MHAKIYISIYIYRKRKKEKERFILRNYFTDFGTVKSKIRASQQAENSRTEVVILIPNSFGDSRQIGNLGDVSVFQLCSNTFLLG